MQDLSLHILDIVENATAAGADLVTIHIEENAVEDRLTLLIRDNGRGMDPELLEKVRDPFATTRTTRRVGMGVPLLDQAARETGGGLTIRSEPGKGTELVATFQAGHIDRKPLGDIASTLISLIMGSPEVDFDFRMDRDGDVVEVDTREIREQLDGAPINDPTVLGLIRGLFS